MVSASTLRFHRIDVLRGLAVVWMTLYHFGFDLSSFGWWRQNFYRDPFWTWQRIAIVTLFLFCAGLGQAAATVRGQERVRFWRRWLQIAGCALLVTAGSMLMFPKSFIYFGVLHGIAVMLVIVRSTARWGAWLWVAGAGVFALKLLSDALHARALLPQVLNHRSLNWLGLIGQKLLTEDYVPLVPWLGVMWWGMATGLHLLRQRPTILGGPVPSWSRPLAWLGRWTLSWYMLHQPILIALLAGATAARWWI